MIIITCQISKLKQLFLVSSVTSINIILRYHVINGNFVQVEEDCIGCPLPSTPEDENVLDSEMSDVLKAAVLGTGTVVSAIISYHLI